ncbi:MAG: type II secretion system protein GspM [Methylobacter sp.]|jgi:general secretion pathway protein M|nr:type II secretion system protein GspM [Methylobacter sp.]
MIDIKSQQMQRWLAVGLLVAALLLVSLVIIVPVINKGLELYEHKNNLAFTLQQYQRILAKKDAVIDNMNVIKEQHQQRSLLNKQGTAALASAEVQEFIKKAIVDAGGQLSSTQALPVSSKNEFNQITVSVRMTGNSEVLRAVLYKIETAAPLIVVNQLDIRPMRGVRSRVTRQIEPSNELNINFQAVSFMRKEPE